MKPSSLRMRAISVFNFEAGTSTFGWRAWIAFRTRVSMSAIGSLVIKLLKSREQRSGGAKERRMSGGIHARPFFALLRLYVVAPCSLSAASKHPGRAAQNRQQTAYTLDSLLLDSFAS